MRIEANIGQSRHAGAQVGAGHLQRLRIDARADTEHQLVALGSCFHHLRGELVL
jgi:hypothetical protein